MPTIYVAMKITVREAPIEDAVKVNSTITEFDERYPKEHFEERYAGKEKLILVAYVGKQPAGYVVAYDKLGDGSFYCWMAGVNPAFRGKGILKAMMVHVERWAKAHGYGKISIKTRNNRREMLAYLVKYGFNFMEVEKHSDIADNRILLEKKI